jgi:hypothetical protein
MDLTADVALCWKDDAGALKDVSRLAASALDRRQAVAAESGDGLSACPC